jgi:ketosteroid isomerase-like protein
MTEDQVREVVARMTTDPDPEREYELRHPDCVIDIPQSRERFDRDGMRELQRNFPGGAPEMNLARLAGEGDVWVAELVSDYGDRPGGGVFNVCVILEFRDGRIARETRYYAEPFEAPEGRAQWRLPNEG